MAKDAEKKKVVFTFNDDEVTQVTQMDRAPTQSQRLGAILLRAGTITEEQLDLALSEQKRTRQLLGNVLLALGFVSEDGLSQALAVQTGTEHVDLKDVSIDSSLFKLVPEEAARQYNVFPLNRDADGRLLLAIDNVMNVVALDALKKLTGVEIKPVSAGKTAIAEAIETHYVKGKKSLEDLFEQSIRLAENQQLSETEVDALSAISKEGPIVQLVDRIIDKAVDDRGTDIHLEPEERVVRLRYRVDGHLMLGPSLPKSLQLPVIARIKIMSALNISESRLPQDGKINFSAGNNRVLDLRVSTYPTTHGENVVIRVLDKTGASFGLDHLGFSDAHLQVFQQLIQRPNGIILVTGPTGSGKTTTLYSALAAINTVDKNIMTIEDPIEYELPLIRQSQVNVKAGYTFATGLRAILRQDPNVVLVGEMRDEETAEIAVRSAMTGHLVFSTLHTNDAVGAIPRLKDMGVQPYLISSTLLAVVAQRLVRTLCPKCRESYQASEGECRRLMLPQGKSAAIYRAKGCSECGGAGFKGRRAIYEMFTVSPRIRQMIQEDVSLEKIRQVAVEEGMRRLYYDGVEKVLQGHTTLDEIDRVAVRERVDVSRPSDAARLRESREEKTDVFGTPPAASGPVKTVVKTPPVRPPAPASPRAQKGS